MAKNKNTIEFLGIWEKIYNQDFKPVEFGGFKTGRFEPICSFSKAMVSQNAIRH